MGDSLNGHSSGRNGTVEPDALQGNLREHLQADGGHGGRTDPSSGSKRPIASTTIGGRTYPLKTVVSCHVCASVERDDIERAVLRGLTHTTIAAHIRDERVTPRNIRAHFDNGHLPITDEVTARLQEQAEERGRVVEEGVEVVMDSLALSRRVRAAVIERLESGDLSVSVRDGLIAESALAKAEAGESLDNAALVRGFMSWVEAIKRHCTPEQAKAIGDDIRSDPALTALQAEGIARHR